MLLFVGGSACVAALLGIATFAGYALYAHRWRSAIFRILGPVTALATVCVLAQFGWAPLRVAFELARPYYLFRVRTAAPDTSGHKRISFLQFDKELWSGHARREIVYANDGAPLPKTERNAEAGGCVWTSCKNLGLGFYARESREYFAACP